MENQNPQNNNSLLDQIIATSKENANQAIMGQVPNGNIPNQQNGISNTTQTGAPPPKKPRTPMSTGMILRLIGTLLLVCLIFMGMFLAYIVFNPQEAGFFQTIFNISRNDVTKVLAILINVSFGIISFILSIVFIFTLFKAIWIPKEQKRKKLTMGLFATFSGIIFFTILAFWAFLFAQLQAANFLNPEGDILIYDNDLYVHEETKDISELYTTNSLIGPITLRYNISDNARTLAKKNGVQLDRYEIDFKGAKCANGTSKIEGINPQTATEIVCTFDELKNYPIEGRYFITKFDGTTETINLNLNPVQIQGLIKIEEKENQNGKTMRAYDASSLRNFGTPVWFYDHMPDKKIRENYISLSPSSEKVILHFYLDNNTKTATHYRRFVIQDGLNTSSDGIITMTQNTANPQEYIFKLENLIENPDEILSTEWKINNSLFICQEQKGNTCTHTFSSYGQVYIEATIHLLGNRTKKISNTFTIEAPLSLERNLKITDTNGKLLNPDESYDLKARTYIIKNITPPQKVFLDARDVIVSNVGYSLKEVNWNISDGRTSEKRTGERIEFDIKRTSRYNITAEYIFEKNIKTGRPDDTRKVTENILFDLERKNLSAFLKVQASSDYVPARVVVDASESHSEYSEIVKFIYDFGEGRPAAEGDAIQTYTYNTPGEKTITVTVVDKNGEQSSTKQTLVLKDTPKNLNFTTSLSPGIVNMPVDFVATGSTGQIEDYLWNFNDNTPISHGYEVSHTFTKSGKYNVVLTIRYTDGTEKTTSQTFVVVDSLE